MNVASPGGCHTLRQVNNPVLFYQDAGNCRLEKMIKDWRVKPRSAFSSSELPQTFIFCG
jgi:hypothetical protein